MDITKILEKYHMVQQGDLVLAAVSGGADSVCMLRLLLEAAPEMNFMLAAVHVEHGIRGKESQNDARFTQELCERLGVQLRVCHVDVPAYASENGLGYEEAARQLRYEVFDRLAEEIVSGKWALSEAYQTEGAEARIHIALAHHQQDQAETVLFRLARGSGPQGLAGMRPVWKHPHGYDLIRPMLDMRKETIETLLTEWGQACCVDETNQDISYARNRLRHQVLPQLSQVNGKAVEHIAQTAEILAEQQDYMEKEAAEALTQIAQFDGEEVRLDIPGLEMLHPALQREVLRQALVHATKRKRDLTAGHVEQLLALTQKQSGSRLSLPYETEAIREFSGLWIRKQEKRIGADDAGFREGDSKAIEPESAEGRQVEVRKEDLETVLAGGEPPKIVLGKKEILKIDVIPVNNLSENRKKKYTKCLDYDMIKQGFWIRRRREGDYLRMSSGHRKKLKQYLIEARIPAEKRRQLWLLAQDSSVIWVVGGRAGADCELAEKSRYAVCVTYMETDENEP